MVCCHTGLVLADMMASVNGEYRARQSQPHCNSTI